MGQYHPINIFLKQEIDRLQKVISTVRATLMDLKLAIDGIIVMNDTLRDALDCMYDARIPNHWLKVMTCKLDFVSWDSIFSEEKCPPDVELGKLPKVVGKFHFKFGETLMILRQFS